MTIRKILAKTLDSLKPGKKVTDFDCIDLQQSIIDLKETLAHKQQEYISQGAAGAGVGLAGNQIGIEDQVYVVSVLSMRATKENCEPVKPTVYINAKIISAMGEISLPEEACLSVVGIAGLNVKRHERITVEYFDEDGVKHQDNFSGFIARIHQHEIDHNEGKEYLSQLNFIQAELEQILQWCDNKVVHVPGAIIVDQKLKCTSVAPDVDSLKTWATIELSRAKEPTHSESQPLTFRC